MTSMASPFLAVFLLTFSLVYGPSGGERVQQSVTINGQVELDDAENFDFRRLSVFVQHRASKKHAWTIDGSVIPNEDGRFNFQVPAANWVSVEVTTTDPTVRYSSESTDDVGFYRFKNGSRETVMLREVYVSEDSPPQLAQTLELYRGAAFSVCIPNGMKSGSIQFHKQWQEYEKGILMASFADSENLRGAIIGGVAPGQWEVLYLDENDKIRSSQLLDLRRGQIMKVECQRKVAARISEPKSR